MTAFGIKVEDAEASSFASLLLPPENAIDNDLKTWFQSDIVDDNMVSEFLWLQIQLESYSVVERVHVTFGDKPERESNVEVRVGNSKIDPSSTFEQQNKTIFKNQICDVYPNAVEKLERIEMVCEKRLMGTHVSVQVLDKTAQLMQIAEIVVYGKSKDIFYLYSFMSNFSFKQSHI